MNQSTAFCHVMKFVPQSRRPWDKFFTTSLAMHGVLSFSNVFYRELDSHFYRGIFCLKDAKAKYGCLIQYSCLLCTERGKPGCLNRVQISLCAHTLLHILYVMNIHQGFWICNSADTNIHAEIEEIPKISALRSEKLVL